MNERARAQEPYSKLLAWYPQGFHEQFAESIEQTFNDLYNERKRRATHGFASFVFWTFSETAIGIIREYALLFTHGDPMKTLFANLRSPALISALLVLPFMILEWATRSNLPRSNASIMLFVIMWLFPMMFILILTPIVRNIRAGNNILAKPVSLLLSVVVLVWIAWQWSALVIDQMPCFLGGTGC